MSSPITINGLGSGLDYNTWINELVAVKQADIDKVSSQVSTIQKQESTLSSLKSDYADLQSAIQALTNLSTTDSVFNQKTATSSSSAITAQVDSTASAQSITVGVGTLATATTAQSASTVASNVDTNTKISDIAGGAAQAGTFSVYVGGAKNTLTITADETLGDVLNSLNGITYVDGNGQTRQAVQADVTGGKLTIQGDNGASITVGASSDTSNFSKVMSLARNTTTGTYASSKAIFSTNTNTAITGASFANGQVTAGTFTIGNATITIDSGSTLQNVINKINNNSDSGATAYWDSSSGKLKLTAKDDGATNINIEAGTSNFTDIMGLTNSTWNPDGSVATTQLASDTQTLGTNATLTINGTSITSSSNTITSDISGIKGLTLTLNDETSSAANVSITNDTSAAVDAITKFVSAYNTVISDTTTDTSSSGDLYGQSILSMLKTTVQQNATGAVSFDNAYKSLVSIGISTGAVTTDLTKDTTKLQVDTDKLTSALQSNPDAVMNLLLGTNATKTNGVLTKIGTNLENSLNAVSGYFVTQENSYEKQVTNLNTKITNMTTDLKTYQSNLEAKFQAMDELISNLEESGSIFDKYFNSSSSSSSSSSNNSNSIL